MFLSIVPEPFWLDLHTFLFRSPGGSRIWDCRIVWNRRITLPLGRTSFKVLNINSNGLPITIIEAGRKKNSGACQQVSAVKLYAYTVSASLLKIFKCFVLLSNLFKNINSLQFLCLSQLIAYSHFPGPFKLLQLVVFDGKRPCYIYPDKEMLTPCLLLMTHSCILFALQWQYVTA